MNENQWASQLLPQDGRQEQRYRDLERRILMSIERKGRQVVRMKVIAAAAWIALLVIVALGGAAEFAGLPLAGATAAAIARATLLLAVFFTLSWYVRRTSLQFDIVKQALAAIQEKLDCGDGREGE